jgi:DNA-directed RNA polymerase subunit RPC12/RpoP
MRRCPLCGTEIRVISFLIPRPDGTITCPNCSGQLYRTLPRRSVALIAISMAPLFAVLLRVAFPIGASDLIKAAILTVFGLSFAFFGAIFIILRHGELKPMSPPIICPKCGSALPASNDAFCARCGADLTETSEPVAPPVEPESAVKHKRETPRKRVHERVCMVCDLALESNDTLAWCPYCGSVAHRGHLVQWVRTKKRCPMCSHRLDERSLADEAPRLHHKDQSHR